MSRWILHPEMDVLLPVFLQALNRNQSMQQMEYLCTSGIFSQVQVTLYRLLKPNLKGNV